MNVAFKSLSVLLTLGIAACASAGPAADPGPSTGPAVATTPPAESPTVAPATSTAGGAVFSAAQANRGRDTFRSVCTECHFSAEFSDSQFKFKWSRRSAGNLYELIFTQMPESAPGSLSEDEAVSLVSYILRMNGFEPGVSELAADRGILDAISLASIRN